MDAHLMRSPGLQSAFDKRVVAQFFEDADMSDRPLSLAGRGRTAAAAVTTIAYQPRFDLSFFGPAAYHTTIDTLDGMRAKLSAEVALGFDRPREHHQTTCVLIEPMDGPYLGSFGALTQPSSPR